MPNHPRMIIFLFVVLATVMCHTPSRVFATPIVDSNGSLIGATGVIVNGVSFDVELLGGSCAALFSGCDGPTDFDFTTGADADAAAQALLDQVFVNGPDGAFDDLPRLTAGCSGVFGSCETLIPFTNVGTLIIPSSVINNGVPGPSDLIGGPIFFASDDTRVGNDRSLAGLRNFARFSQSSTVPAPAPAPAPAPVPEPSAMLLMGLGLAGLIGWRWKKGQQLEAKH